MSRNSDIYRRIMINQRRTLSGCGGVVADALLPCPTSHGTVPLENCARCGQCDAFFFDGTAEGSFIVCKAMPTPREIEKNGAAVPDEERALPAALTPVREIMSRDVVCIRGDLTLATAAELFLARGISGAPVVDEKGCPIGVISKTDVVREFVEREGAGGAETRAPRKVEDLMTPTVLSLTEDAPIARAAALMASHHLHRLPVVSSECVVIGIVSSLDVLGWIARENEYLIPLCHEG